MLTVSIRVPILSSVDAEVIPLVAKGVLYVAYAM